MGNKKIESKEIKESQKNKKLNKETFDEIKSMFQHY